MNRMELGQLGELAVCYYLEALGYEIRCRNFRIRGGEIDIVAVRGDELCFAEVKTRSLETGECGVAAVDSRKCKRLIRTAFIYCEKHNINPNDWCIRYDIADVTAHNGRIIDIDYLENAFKITDFYDNSYSIF